MPRKITRIKTSSADAPLYQLKVTLKGSKPPIWRRVVVRADTPLDCLHDVIQIVMGWTNSQNSKSMPQSNARGITAPRNHR